MSGSNLHASDAFNALPKKRIRSSKDRSSRTASSPITLRLTPDERDRLETLADGMTLSAYIRFCIFSKRTEKRRQRPKAFIADRQAVAQALALLGQSRIANNLNQLAYQANVGALVMDDEAYAQIDETYQYISEIRSLLIKALTSSA